MYKYFPTRRAPSVIPVQKYTPWYDVVRQLARYCIVINITMPTVFKLSKTGKKSNKYCKHKVKIIIQLTFNITGKA